MTPRIKHSRGLLVPLAERIRRLEKELADQKRIADGEIHRLTTENHKLAQALKAMTPEPPAEPIKETPDE